MRSNPDPAEFNEFPGWSLAGFPDSVAHSAADRAAGRTAGELVRQPLSRSRMKEIAREVAGSPGAWERLVRMDPDNRWHQRLYSAADYDVWLESWLPGQTTGWHDHAGTSGVLVVARGELEERVSVLNGVFTQVRHVPEGVARRMAPAPGAQPGQRLARRPRSASTSTRRRWARPAATRSAPWA